MLLVLIAIVTMGGLVAIARPGGVERLGVGAIVLAAATAPWSAVQLHGVPLCDFPLAIGLILLFFARPKTRFSLPAPIILGAALVALSGVITALEPPSADYLASRYELSQSYLLAFGATVRSTSNLGSLLKYEVALFLVPLAAVLACRGRPHFARLAARALLIGVLLSDLVAYTDHIGLTHVSASLIGYANVSGRQAGLTPYANFVGVETAIVLPILLYELLKCRRGGRILSVFGLAVSALALDVSGSRGSAIATLIAVPITFVVVPALRRHVAFASFLGVVIGVMLFLTPLGGHFLTDVRLAGPTTSVQVSNASRASEIRQAFQDLAHYPVHGVGWGYANNAQMIYLQVLAAGGVLAGLGFLVLVVGVLRVGWRLGQNPQSYAGVLVASIVTWLTLGLVENQLTDQWVYVPVALLAALAVDARETASSRMPDTVRTQAIASPLRAGMRMRPTNERCITDPARSSFDVQTAT